MRKTLTLLVMTLVCVMAMGQESIKVVAKFKKGDYVVYDVQQKISQVSGVDGTTDVTFVGESRYDVLDADQEGYTIAMKTQKWESLDSINDDLSFDLVNSAMKMLVGQTIIFRTDSEGKVIKIQNLDEVMRNLETYVDGIIEKMFSNEMMDNQDIISKERMRNMMLDQITEDQLMKNVDANDQFSLYGKTISTGTTADKKYSNLKFKTTYEVLPVQKAGVRTIKSSSVSDMTPEDLKSMILSQVEKVMPEQADMLKENFDAVMESGLLKIEGTKESTFDILDNGWFESSDSFVEINTMGVVTKNHTTSVIKACSWAK